MMKRLVLYFCILFNSYLSSQNRDPYELDSIFHVPLSFFVSDERIRTDRFQRQIGHRWSPAYDFDGYEIWGFTSRLLTNFLSSALDVDIGLEHPAPVKHWGPKA